MNFWKSIWQPAYAQLLMISFLLGMTAALFSGVERALSSAEASLRPSLQVTLVLPSSFSDAQADVFSSALRSQDPDILSTVFVSRQEALEQAQKDPVLAKSIMLLKENPLPSSILLRYDDRAWLERSEPAETLKPSADIQEILWDPRARSTFRSLHQWRVWIFRLSGLCAAMLIVWSFFGIYRFLSLRSSFSRLILTLSIGLCGAAAAAGVWFFTLQNLGADAALYWPRGLSVFPLLIGAAAGIGFFGLGARCEN